MSHGRKTHEQCLADLCTFCGRKCGPGGRELQDVHVNHIKSNLFAAFDKFKDLLPFTVCSTCRKDFLKITSPKINYSALIEEMQKIPKCTRSNPDGCPGNCPVCEIGRSSGRQSKTLSLTTKFPPASSSSASNLENASVEDLMKNLPQSTRLSLASATLKEASPVQKLVQSLFQQLADLSMCI